MYNEIRNLPYYQEARRVVRHDWYREDDFALTYEYVAGVLMVHIEIHNYSKKIRTKLLSKTDEIKEFFRERGFSHIFSYTKDERVPRIVGATFYGEKYGWKVYGWELN